MNAALPRIRAARVADLEGLLALETLFPSDRMSRASLRRFLGSPRACLLVAEGGDGRLLGNALLLMRAGSRRARLYSIVVANAARGLGLGARLLDACEDVARQRGCGLLALEVRRNNAAALALYRTAGYAVDRELPGYYDDGADGLRLIKRLSHEGSEPAPGGGAADKRAERRAASFTRSTAQ